MLKFTNFIVEEVRPTLTSSGKDAERHVSKYITPYLPGNEHHSKGTHTVAYDIDGLQAGDAVTLHKHIKKQTRTGKIEHHVVVSKVDSKKQITIPISKLRKPGKSPINIGRQFESKFIAHLKKHGLMPQEASGAGFTAGTDFLLQNKQKKTTHKGRVSSSTNLFSGETKADINAAFGQLTITHTPERGWHITDKARAKRPRYAKAIEEAGILDHMNKHFNPDEHNIPVTNSGRAKTITFKHKDLKPADAYLQDHHVDVLHVGNGYGTYHVGSTDATGHGLPAIKGKGKWVVREKQAGNKQVLIKVM